MASLGVVGGYPQFAGQTSTAGQYTPQIFSQKILRKFYLNTCFSDIANVDYQGEIKAQGDKVVIRTVPDITIRPYTKGQDLVYETPVSAEVELEINKANYYACRIDKIDEIQNDVKMMNMWADDSAEKMKIAIERDVFSFYSDAHASNIGATAGAVDAIYNMGTTSAPISLHTGATTGTDINIIDFIMYAEAVLSEQNVPEDDQRWMVLPTWACMLLQTSDLRRADSMGLPGSVELLRNGKLGRIGQFTIYRSNNLPKVSTETIIPFGHKSGLTFASQLVENETLPHPTSFGHLLRGLQVYGYKVVLPAAIGYGVAKKK